MTNPEVVNPYLRALLARELLGYRKVYLKNDHAIKSGLSCAQPWLNNTLYVTKRQVCRRSFGRVDLHLRMYRNEVLEGDPSPLKQYPASFAGH